MHTLKKLTNFDKLLSENVTFDASNLSTTICQNLTEKNSM